MIEAMPKRRPDTDQTAHDVLAAEEFGMPAPDPVLHHGPVRLPDDPTGIVGPHDVLAAEEFAMPAGRWGADGKTAAGEGGSGNARARLAFVLGVALALLLRKRHR